MITTVTTTTPSSLEAMPVNPVNRLLGKIQEAALALPHPHGDEVLQIAHEWHALFSKNYQMHSPKDSDRTDAAHALLFFRLNTIAYVINTYASGDEEKIKWLQIYNELTDIVRSILPKSIHADAFIEDELQEVIKRLGLPDSPKEDPCIQLLTAWCLSYTRMLSYSDITDSSVMMQNYVQQLERILQSPDDNQFPAELFGNRPLPPIRYLVAKMRDPRSVFYSQRLDQQAQQQLNLHSQIATFTGSICRKQRSRKAGQRRLAGFKRTPKATRISFP